MSKYEMPALELPAAGKHGSGGSTHIGYKIEVRTSSSQSTRFSNDFVIDAVWRTFPIFEGASPFGINVPVSSLDREMLFRSNLVSRIAAEAHRWAFLAAMEAANIGGALCIETRLVQVEIKTSWSTEENGVSDVVIAPYGSNSGDFHRRGAFLNQEQFVKATSSGAEP